VNKKWIKSGGGEAIYYWSEVSVQEGVYSYAIATIDSIASIVTTTPYYTTKVNNPNSLLILVLGDLQDKTINPETDSAVIQLAKAHNPDFILQLGDLIDRPHQDKWDIYYHSFEPLRTSVPIISIVGNHDYHKGINKYPDERFFYTFPYFLDDENNAPKIGCCKLDFGNNHIYILDSNQPIFRQFKQYKWLKNRLKNAEKGVNKIIALHHPLRSARSKFNNIFVRWIYEGVVKKYGVEFVFAGHEHTNHTLTKEETGGYNQIITNFSSKNYDSAKGEKGRKTVELWLENGKINLY
jgi:predicted MPP superfamily phosphohydrolase